MGKCIRLWWLPLLKNSAPWRPAPYKRRTLFLEDSEYLISCSQSKRKFFKIFFRFWGSCPRPRPLRFKHWGHYALPKMEAGLELASPVLLSCQSKNTSLENYKKLKLLHYSPMMASAGEGDIVLPKTFDTVKLLYKMLLLFSSPIKWLF